MEDIILDSFEIKLKIERKMQKKLVNIIKKDFKNKNFTIKTFDDEIRFRLKNKNKIVINSECNDVGLLEFNLKPKPDIYDEIALNFNFENIKNGQEKIDIKEINKTIPIDFKKCFLKSIEPSESVLSPKFSSEIYNYEIKVPHSVNSIEFKTEGKNGTEKIKVNRKRLLKPGKTTEINLKVSDKNAKNTYRIKVSRDEKPIEASKNKNRSKNLNKKAKVKKSKKIKTKKIKEPNKSPNRIATAEINNAEINNIEMNEISEEKEEHQPEENLKNKSKSYFKFLGTFIGIVISLGVIYEFISILKKKKLKN
jgi:hypothetical protein